MVMASIREGGRAMTTTDDRDFLIWLYDRLENIHGENPTVDYMMKLRSIIDRTPPEGVYRYYDNESQADGAGNVRVERLENKIEELEAERDLYLEVLMRLVEDCMASDFNEHWESFQTAEALVAGRA
jgi:hypothetical protein